MPAVQIFRCFDLKILLEDGVRASVWRMGETVFRNTVQKRTVSIRVSAE